MRSYITLFLLGLFSTIGTAQTYLLYNSECISRYDYRSIQNPDYSHHIDYHYKTPYQANFVFRVDAQSARFVTSLPAGTQTCGNVKNMVFSFIDDVNAGAKSLYLVEKSGEGYAVFKTEKAYYMEHKDQFFYYYYSDHSFRYDYAKDYKAMENLSHSKSELEIFLAGEEEYRCGKKYFFRKLPDCKCPTFFDNEILPGIGILNEKTNDNEYQLVAIDGIPTDDYYAAVCNNQTPVARITEVTRGASKTTTVVEAKPAAAAPPKGETLRKDLPDSARPVYYDDIPFEAPLKEDLRIKSPNEDEVAKEASAATIADLDSKLSKSLKVGRNFNASPSARTFEKQKTHIVKKGDTLYAISKRYDISLAQLREKNNINGNNIQIGQVLKVGE